MGTFKSLDNIETSFKLMKTTFIVFIIACALICIGAVALSFYSFKMASNRIYVIDGEGQSLIATASTIADNREAEIKNHLVMLYSTFFSYDPSNVESQTKKGLDLMGQSGKELYQTFVEEGWYNRVLQNNITLKSIVEIDSIQVNADVYPYEAYAKGYQIISRETFFEKRVLEFKCILIDISRSDVNPHGLLIENFNLIDNKTVENEY